MNDTSQLMTVIFLVTVIVNIAIASFVYVNNVRHVTNKLFFALSVSIIAWLLVMWGSSLPRFSDWTLWMARLSLICATPLNVLFYFFATTVPDEMFGVTRRRAAVVGALAISVIAISASPLTISGIVTENGVSSAVTGAGMAAFGIFQTILNAAAIHALFKKLRHAKGERYKQLQLVLIGILVMVGLITGTIFLPVLALGDSSFVPFAPLYVLVFTALTGYSIFRKGLLDVKVVAAEFFSAALMLFGALQIFQASSAVDLSFRIITFIAVCFFSFLFIRSVRAEVRRREQVQDLAQQLERSNESLESANVHLKELDARKDEFISIASHQLRTPVAVMKGYLSLMQEAAYGPMPEYLKDKVDNMMMMNERLVQMIDNMLNVTRIEKNRIEFSCALVDVHPVLDQVVEQLQPKAGTKGLAVALGDVPSGPLVAYVDFEKLVEVLTNLVDNAIKYSTFGTITISAVALPKKKSIVISVEDQGLGMDLETSKKVFQKFYRSNNPAVLVQGGTGLGLYVCAMFVRGMGGDIWIEKTAPDEGTTISFALPTQPGGECLAPSKKISPK